jgi:hypothetical protein
LAVSTVLSPAGIGCLSHREEAMKTKRVALLAACWLLGGLALALVTLYAATPWVCSADCRDDPCPVPPCCNGDVNADGLVNLADPVFILQYLFIGGPEPSPFHGGNGGGGALPGTGQEGCWDDTGDPVACDSSTCGGQDGRYQPGCASAGRFTDNGNGTVTDTCTGLTWMKDPEATTMKWCEALEYCENLTLGDRSDWRLPTIRELQSIVDYGRHDPAIDPVFGARSTWYFSSTTYVSELDDCWVVGLLNGHVSNVDKRSFNGAVLAVRNGS